MKSGKHIPWRGIAGQGSAQELAPDYEVPRCSNPDGSNNSVTVAVPAN
ncbi:hypothetical protein CUZ56_00314 [Saezia sanguinis]|uniref:Uncharacterized protein n=1 Tax=Saezia sanguinis TaxID=1965230 RepID=A0A433SGQ4_9BURK|nr:hypothetical protein [Saezia sanguinis]RUS67834.1 hypothetical protein CUZ56_00314 [Saezia sanguinis]